MAKHQFELAGDAEHYPISIEVFGFLKGASLSPIEVAKLLQLLPSHNISGLRKIVYKRALSKPLNRWFSRTSKARLSGLYSPADHQITLYGGSTREGLAHTLFHEVAHHVYFRVLDSSEKKRWVTVVYPSEKAVSIYGKRNAAEDFAESYATFVMNPGRLQQFNFKYRFLLERIFLNTQIDQHQLERIMDGSCASLTDGTLNLRI